MSEILSIAGKCIYLPPPHKTYPFENANHCCYLHAWQLLLWRAVLAGTKSENLVPSTPVSMSETAGSLSNAMSRTGISYRLQDNRLSLSDGPIVIRDAAFGAVILENGRSRVICPQDEPIVESVVCETRWAVASRPFTVGQCPKGMV